MNEKDFVSLCKRTVAEYANKHLDKTDGKQITEDDVFVVWMCKTLQNSKALASTTLFDGMYYELTYNGDKKELYFDAYKKWENRCVSVKKQTSPVRKHGAFSAPKRLSLIMGVMDGEWGCRTKQGGGKHE